LDRIAVSSQFNVSAAVEGFGSKLISTFFV